MAGREAVAPDMNQKEGGWTMKISRRVRKRVLVVGWAGAVLSLSYCSNWFIVIVHKKKKIHTLNEAALPSQSSTLPSSLLHNCSLRLWW